jgi:hypothetical protein
MNVCSFRAPTVKLIDGTEVSSDSEAWRAECEARGVLSMRDKGRRRMYLFGVEKKRGMDSRNLLEADIWRLFRHYNALPEDAENNFMLRA